MAIEDDIASLQSQIEELQSAFSSLQASVADINTSLTGKAPIANPSFTGTVKIDNSNVATQDYVTEEIDNLKQTDIIPSSPAVISGGGYDAAGNPVDYSSTGAVGTRTEYARADHKHPGDITRAPIESPTFKGIPCSNFTPNRADVEYDGNCLATTHFVITAIKESSAPTPPVTTPPTEEGGLPQAGKTDEPGGNSENFDSGGGGKGGKKGKGGGPENGIQGGGDSGTDGTDGEDAFYMIKETFYNNQDIYDWNIASYVHTSA